MGGLRIGAGIGIGGASRWPYTMRVDALLQRYEVKMGQRQENLSFDQLITFTRTSAATYVNSAGNVVQTPASKNLLLWTEVFSDAAWSKSNATITGNNVVGPDGRNTADTLTEDATTSIHRVNATYTFASTATHTFSVYAKAAGRNFCRVSNGTDNIGVFVNFSTGAVVSVTAGASAAVTNAGNGWWRIALTFTPATAASKSMAINLSDDGASLSYAGNGTSGILIWGAQLELGSTATSYVKNDGGLFPARFDYDPATLAPKGLLIESQRTNLLLRSEEFDNASWTKSAVTATANATTSPDGTVDADSLVADTSTGGHQATQTATTTATATTFSVYAKQNGYTWVALGITDSGSTVRVSYFNLAAGTVGTVGTGITASIVNAGNGWYRCIVTVATALAGSNTCRIYATNADGVTSFTGDGTSGIYIWGAQLEAGSYATSYIPTAGSQVTCTADTASIVAPNFAPWYNQSEGTFVVEADTAKPTSVVAEKLIVDANDGTINNRHYLGFVNAKAEARATVGGVNQAVIQQDYAANATEKLAYAYKANDFAFARNGSLAGTDASGSLPTIDRMFIGNALGSAAHLDGHIRSIRYFPTRLSNAQLQAFSA